MIRTFAILLLSFLVPGGPACADQLQPLLDALDSVRDAAGVPAYGLAVVESERTLYAGSRGIADLASGRIAGDDTVFRIGSITKTFTALAFLAAVRDGILNLDMPYAEIAGDGLLTNPWAATDPVRLVHLLEHTAGLGDLSMEEMYHSDPAPMGLADAVRFRPENRRALWRPGIHYSYSNAGAGLASYALERATGIDFERFVSQRVLEPLQMTGATLRLDARVESVLATGYDTNRSTPIPYWHMLFRAFGALNATPREMAALPRLLLGRGRYAGRQILAPEAIDRMERAETTLAARSGLHFGYGLGVYAWYHHGTLFYGHGGDGDGYLAHFGYAPSRGQGYFLVINAFTHAPLSNMRRLVESFIAGEEPFSDAAGTDVAEATGVTGTYRRATHRFPPAPGEDPDRMEIGRSADSLYTQVNDGVRRALIPAGANHFRRADEPAATIAIVADPQGRLVFQGERENFMRTQPAVNAAR